jgi:hypothetical protein
VDQEPKTSKRAAQLMIAIVIGFALVALYANIQKLRRAAIETVKFIPASNQSATPQPTASPR